MLTSTTQLLCITSIAIDFRLRARKRKAQMKNFSTTSDLGDLKRNAKRESKRGRGEGHYKEKLGVVVLLELNHLLLNSCAEISFTSQPAWRRQKAMQLFWCPADISVLKRGPSIVLVFFQTWCIMHSILTFIPQFIQLSCHLRNITKFTFYLFHSLWPLTLCHHWANYTHKWLLKMYNLHVFSLFQKKFFFRQA